MIAVIGFVTFMLTLLGVLALLLCVAAEGAQDPGCLYILVFLFVCFVDGPLNAWMFSKLGSDWLGALLPAIVIGILIAVFLVVWSLKKDKGWF